MIYPVSKAAPYGEATFGGQPGSSLAPLRIVPRLHLPERLTEMALLAREPTPWDVRTAGRLGGFPVAAPLVVPAMGSTAIAHRHGIATARAAAQAGIPLVLGENIATVHGYDRPRSDAGVTFKDRLMAYLDVLAEAGPAAPGGIVIQQSVEDAMDELWWKVYTDPDVLPHLEAGRIGFEIKVGQGAKPGLGGLTLVDDAQAAELGRDYHLGSLPVEDGHGEVRRERFSAPGTFTTDILEAQVRHLTNDFPKARFWVKLPPSRDALDLAAAAARGGAHMVTLDGAEAGSALAPTIALDSFGLPLLALAAGLPTAALPATCDVLFSGGLATGADAAKAMALGASGAAFGRAILQAVVDGGEEAGRLAIEALAHELRIAAYAAGELDTSSLDRRALACDDQGLATALGIDWTYVAAVPHPAEVPAARLERPPRPL
ncbi:MAG: alpha-hydroxy-acid oxidizing protein [Thermoplasmatota archaeon]